MPPSERKSLMELAGVEPGTNGSRSATSSKSGTRVTPSSGKSSGDSASTPAGASGNSMRMMVLGGVILVLCGVAYWMWRTPEPEITPEEVQALQAPPEEVVPETQMAPTAPGEPETEPPALE